MASLLVSDAAEAVAQDLLRIGAVALRPSEPFQWASGRLAPVYTDNRLTLGHPAVRRRLTDAFAGLITALPGAPTAIAGTATAGIPHAAWLADRLDLPMVYVRASAKAHGRGNQIEGPIAAGDRVVLIEDLISTGGSAAAAADALRDAGAHVDAILAIFSYGLDAAAELVRPATPVWTLTDIATLARVARDEGGLSGAELDALAAWRDDPSAWSVARGGSA